MAYEQPDKTKRYMLFAGSEYYPSGGMDDLKGTFDTVEEATAEGYAKRYDWFHVVDRETLDVVLG